MLLSASIFPYPDTVEAPLGVIGIRDIWGKIYPDVGYLKKRFWDIELALRDTNHWN